MIPERCPRLVRLALWTVAALLVPLVVAVQWDPPGLSRHWWDEWGYFGLILTTAVLVLARAVVRKQGRLGWLLVGLGLLSTSAGNLAYVLDGYDGARPFVSPNSVDVLWLLAYPLQAAGVVALVLGDASRLRRSAALDALVAALGTATVTAFTFGPVSASATGGTAAVATALAYPAFDLLLASICLGALAALGWPLRGPWGSLTLGFAISTAADIVYSQLAANGTYADGTLLDAVWPVGALLTASAAWQAPRAAPHRADVRLLTVPALVTLVSLLVLLGDVGGFHVPVVAQLLAAASVVAVAVRIAFTVREVAELTDSRRQARTDDLTDLANRRHFRSAVTAAVTSREEDACSQVAVLLLDLDRFKEVNDTLGHHVGDDLLVQIGPRFARVLEDGQLLARLGGDEFAVLLPVSDAHHAAAVACRLLAALREPFDLAGIRMQVDGSIGISLSPLHADGVGGLLQQADIAMYRAKAARTGYEISTGQLTRIEAERLLTLEQLRAALDGEQLVLLFQPKLDLATGSVSGVEALIRWEHPTRGLLLPEDFLALAEQHGMMRRLTLIVLQLALEQVQQWRNEGLELTVAVNLSVSNLLDAQLPEQVGLLLSTLDVPARLLELEITETVLMADPPRALQVLNGLQALGVRIAVDDYGTGYSSLSYLQDLPVHDLKLDRSFVQRSAVNGRSASIVSSTIGLAHALGMRIIAEGVESQHVLDHLIATGCDFAQGFHIGRPQTGQQITAGLRRPATTASSAAATNVNGGAGGRPRR